jgi:hypothetical protein
VCCVYFEIYLFSLGRHAAHKDRLETTVAIRIKITSVIVPEVANHFSRAQPLYADPNKHAKTLVICLLKTPI